MILVTVGTQVPFERMTDAVHAWHVANPEEEVVMQTGVGGPHYAGISCSELLTKDDFDSLIARADLIVSHAGMGSILSALTAAKPIIIVPRSAALKEHRNEHQSATARAMEGKPGITVVWDISRIGKTLNDRATLAAPHRLSQSAPESFIQAIREIIQD